MMKLEFILSFIQFIGSLYFLNKGTFVSTKYFRFSKFFLAIYIIGTLFKLMHWSGYQIFTPIGLLGIVIFYCLSFSDKPIKKMLDYLKLLWVVSYFLFFGLKLNHLINPELIIIPQVIIVIALVEDVRIQKK